LKRRFVEGRIDGVPRDFGGAMPPPTKMEPRFELFFEAALKCRGDGLEPARLRDRFREDDHAGYKAWVESVIAIAGAFEDQLRRRNLIDFSAMVAVPAARLVADERLRARYASRFDHILVDEFQDTSRAQFELLRALSDEDFSSVTVVGDRKQSIYRWRDARVENVLDFPGQEKPLLTNYRSRQNILDIAHAFISTDDEFKDSTDNVALVAHHGTSDYPVVLFHPGAEEDPDAEAEALARWIRHLTGGTEIEGLPRADAVPVEDVAVLLRSLKPAHGLPAIERAFERHGVPYAVVGGANAAETRALESWHATMSLLLPGNRARELLAVLESEPWSVPDVVLWELVRDVKRRVGGIDLLGDEDIERIADPRARDRVSELRSLVGDLEARMVSSDLRSFVSWAVEESPLAIRLFAENPSALAGRVVQDLVVEVLEAFEQVAATERPAGLPAFLEHLRAAIDDKKFREESDVRLPSDRVRVMTVHQSKGLEFRAVAVAGVKPPHHGRDRFYLSHDHGLFFSSKEAKSWERGLADSADAEYEERMEAQEANCLFYVAMTRAREFLWVSTPFCEGRKGKKSESLFTRLLGCVDRIDPVVVLRRPPEIAAAQITGAPVAEPAAKAIDLEEALAAWDGARERLESPRRTIAPSPGELDVVTWPQLYAYRRCPLEYRYRFHTRAFGTTVTAAAGASGTRSREAAVSVPRGLSPADYGVLVHRALELVYGRDAPAGEAVSSAASELPHARVTTSAAESAKRLVDGVLASEVGTPGAHVRVEAPFELRLDSLVFHGVFDRIERAGDRTRVVDYKVGVEDPAHDFQAQAYAWALGRIEDEDADGLVCYLREDGVHIKRVTTSESVAAVEDVAGALEESLKMGDFAATPGAVCASCSYAAVCPHAAR
jgi:superfamily I DNA/RNA helicase/CRISPR/Cas system-associated exonuclease Cas4 (RecB family)